MAPDGSQWLPSRELTPQPLPIVVKNNEEEAASKLNYFSDRRSQGWPFVCTPMSRGKGVVRGVLGIDSFESVSIGRDDEEVPEEGVVEVLQQASAMMGTMMDQKVIGAGSDT